MIRTLAFAGYRSLRDVRIALAPLTVITGANGAGKSNVYRALRLLVEAANGTLGRAIAAEGGMASVMWAGPGRQKTSSGGTRLSIGFGDDAMAYELRLGYLPDNQPFPLDPVVKEETIRTLIKPKVRLLERRNLSVMLRDDEGRPQTFGAELEPSESVMAQLAEPHRYPVLSIARERIRSWRFYHQLRTDADSALRAPQVGTRTPVLAHDGHDLAAALETILHSDPTDLTAAVADAFEGARVSIGGDGNGRIHVALETPGLYRPLTAAELSDGTLRYLALLAALHSPRPPELLVLNEPETSLHPSVLAPLARQIIAAAKQSQVIVVSHAAPLVDALAGAKDAARVELAKDGSETVVANRKTVDAPPWQWTP
ncbi:MAG: AAA family ATPase [Deltaproteobacteria bacterium]|nr:AAA family ATPase [Deltaproteobacteria bacterium]